MASTTNDKRLVAVDREEEKALNKSNTMYNSMIKDSQKYYDQQIQASKDWENTQTKLQQEQTNFAIEKIEQQKDQANKDYVKEQSGAYVDWQKESNRYGANAEEMAASGFVSSGYGESSQVSMWNTYQNRVATARESYNQAVLNYDNAIKDAQLQNNAKLAEIAYQSLQAQLELSLQGLQYKNQLLETQANKQLEIKNIYENKYQNVLNQINKENELAEEIRQYNANLKLQQQKLAEEKRQYNQTLALQTAQLEEEKRQYDTTLAYNKSKSSGSSSGKSSGSNNTGVIKNGNNNNNSNNNNISNVSLKKYKPSFSSYEGAAAYLRQKGVTKGDGGLMTKNEWLRRKNSGSKSAEAQYSSYSAYLSSFVAWRLANPEK